MRKTLLICAAVLLLLAGCSEALPLSISEDDVESIQIGTQTLGSDEAAEFAELFNASKRYRDDVGTTHPIMTTIMLEEGLIIYLWSGTQGFMTVVKNDEQYNIQNKELERFIDSFTEE